MEINTIIETNRIIQEIHDSFYSMDSKTDSKVQLNLTKAYDSNYKQLVNSVNDKFGFNNSKNVWSINPHIIKENEELNDLLNEYSVLYPGKKFITDEQITQLCLKYNLVLTTPDNFIGKIPEKNLRDLDNFNPKGSEEKIFVDFEYDKQFENLYTLDNSSVRKLFSFVATLKSNKLYLNFPEDIRHVIDVLIQRSNSPRRNIIISDYIPNYEERYMEDLELPEVEIFPGLIKSSTMIAATSDLLNLSREGFTVNEKNEYVLSTRALDLKENPYPDPIIFHKVKKGAMIITAWGIESQDEKVFNPIIN